MSKEDPDAGLELLAVRELATGDMFEIGKQIACPCGHTDQYVASLELEKGKGGAIIRYKDGTKLILRAPLVALYRNPVALEPLKGPDPDKAEADALMPVPPEPDPADLPPEGFLDDDQPAQPARVGEITGPAGD